MTTHSLTPIFPKFIHLILPIITNWSEITHWHKPLINLESLKAGTGYDIKYPERVVNGALALIKKIKLNKSEMD